MARKRTIHDAPWPDAEGEEPSPTSVIRVAFDALRVASGGGALSIRTPPRPDRACGNARAVRH